jgi:hypothetical protein
MILNIGQIVCIEGFGKDVVICVLFKIVGMYDRLIGNSGGFLFIIGCHMICSLVGIFVLSSNSLAAKNMSSLFNSNSVAFALIQVFVARWNVVFFVINVKR